MGAMNTYEGPGELYFQARLLAEATKCSVRVNGNNNKVATMKKGLAGKSDGATESEITIENAIPRKGYESDFLEKCVKKEYVRLVVISGGQRHTFNGWVESVEWNNAVDSPAAISMTMVAGAPDSVGG